MDLSDEEVSIATSHFGICDVDHVLCDRQNRFTFELNKPAKWTVTSQNPRITCSNMLHYHPGNCGSCLNMDNVLMTTSELPCQCKSPPRKQTGILHPELRCRWSTPGSSSCAWKPAAGCGTPARSCPKIRQVWPRAWWCRASGSFGDREPSDNVQITAVPAPRGDHKYLRMVDSCACCSTSSAKTFSCCWNGSLW